MEHAQQLSFPQFVMLFSYVHYTPFAFVLFDSIVLKKFQGYRDSISFLKSCQFLFGQPLTSSHQKKKTANSMFKVSGSIKSNDLLLLNSRMFLRYNNDSLRLTFIITMERATFPSPLPASQEYSPLSPSTTFVITR